MWKVLLNSFKRLILPVYENAMEVELSSKRRNDFKSLKTLNSQTQEKVELEDTGLH